MFKIVSTKSINTQVKQFEIEAPAIAKKRLAGQFVILRINDTGERIPVTIADSDVEKGTITIIVQGIGKTTNQLLAMNAGDTILDVVGPLGKPTHVEKFGTAVVIGGGVGTAIAYPTAKALKDAGNKVIVIIGGRTKDLAILQDEISEFADAVYVTTDDGSAGTKGLVTDKLNELINSGDAVDFVLAIGPIPMMQAVANTTKPHNIHTVVSLNPIMLDGTGMCGGCRAIVDGKNVFVCVDGPEFDAHKVDFVSLTKRNRMYLPQEHSANCFFKD
ncbi:MAG: sulfide/dihydroorotate dehydrogenase-like FAD/NAD-binding protein [Ignavibacteria bacterium]|jgi:ferredoxin--NADP+ reductase|nr:sulfide/dihydroorotate dehydrogenase-like FAD/NAD-binding protein [Ignavibacteria bacterium]